MDTLPELAFEKVLSYLSLEDLIRSRAVSRYWRAFIDHLCKATHLCYLEVQRAQIWEYRRIASNRNLVFSTNFKSFFGCFAKTILSNLKHLCLYKVTLEWGSMLFQAINSFGRLEELAVIDVNIQVYLNHAAHHRLNLPNLKRFEVDCLRGIKKLTILNSPKLFEIRIRFYCDDTHYYPNEIEYIRLDIVHTNSVERLDIDYLDGLQLEKFKNLKYLFCSYFKENDLFLPKLERLQEIHLGQMGLRIVCNQKESFKLHNLKVFFCGLPLNDLTDLPGFMNNYMHYSDHYSYSSRYSLTEGQFKYYVENHPRLDDEIPVFKYFDYSVIEAAISRMPMDFWKRFTNLREIRVNKPITVKAIRPFLKFLKDFENIEKLVFGREGQLQKLLDQLPDHCDLQRLQIFGNVTLNLKFLFRLKHLTEIFLNHWIRDPDLLRRVFTELKLLSEFVFFDRHFKLLRVKKLQSQQFEVSGKVYDDLNLAIAAMNFAEPSARTESNSRKANRR